MKPVARVNVSAAPAVKRSSSEVNRSAASIKTTEPKVRRFHRVRYFVDALVTQSNQCLIVLGKIVEVVLPGSLKC